MSDPNTLRILSFDGGGARGYMSLVWFKRFIQTWGINPAALAQQFDVICGTSVGGIVALAYAFGKTPDEIEPFFVESAPYIFSTTSFIPSSRPGLVTKVGLALANIPFYQSSGPTEEDYGAGLLRVTLQNEFGTNTLQNLQTNVIIPSYQYDNSKYVLFSNLNYPEFIGQNELISNVALATSAAPLYLPSILFGGHEYLDGGIYENNPAEFGRTLAQMVKPRANRYCILSIGTGLGEMGFDPGNPDIIDPRVDPALIALLNIAADSTIIFSLFDIAMVGGQESTAQALYLEATNTLSQLYYYRFQPQLDLNINTELDNTDPEIYTYYSTTANNNFNEDIDNISIFIGHLEA